MIDANTGAISFDAVSFVIHPALTREEYLSTPLAGACVMRNEPFASFTPGVLELSGHPFNFTLYFHCSDLTSIDLMTTDESFGTSWADWSEDKELQRKRFHDSWLSKVLGNDRYPYDYTWGTVVSVYDQKAGFSYVSIKYRKRA